MKDNIKNNLIEDFQLPKYVKGKSFADASKAIDNKFKDRKDQYAIQTKEELLERLAEAQEYVKMQEEAEAMASLPPEQQEQMMQQQGGMPEQGGGMPDLSQLQQGMEQPQQMAGGGYAQSTSALTPRGPEFGNYAPSADTSALKAPSSFMGDSNSSGGGGSGIFEGGAQLGGMAIDAFGDSGVDTSGQRGYQKNINVGAETGKAALKGAAAGAAIGSVVPVIGTAIGGAVGAVGGAAMGFIGGSKKHKDISNSNVNAMYNINSQYDNDWQAARGGFITGGGDEEGDKKKKKLQSDVNQATRINFDVDTANRLFEPNTPEQAPFDRVSQLDLGRYKDRGFFDMKDQQSNMVVTPTRSNPQNAQGYNDQIDYLRKLNPNIKLDNQYLQMGSRKQMATGGYTDDENDPYGPQLSYPINYNQYVRPLEYTPEINKVSTPTPWANPIGNEYMSNAVSGRVTGDKPGDNKNELFKKGLDIANTLGSYAPAIGSLFSKTDRANTPRPNQLNTVYNRQLADEQQLQNIINQNNIHGAASETSGGDAGRASANMVAGNLNKLLAQSQSYATNQQLNMAENRAAQQHSLQANSMNSQLNERYIDRKAQDDAAYSNSKTANRNALFNNLGAVSRENQDRKTVEKMFGYKWNGEYLVDKNGKRVSDKEYRQALLDAKKKNKKD